jgi:hypothetical protein
MKGASQVIIQIMFKTKKPLLPVRRERERLILNFSITQRSIRISITMDVHIFLSMMMIVKIYEYKPKSMLFPNILNKYALTESQLPFFFTLTFKVSKYFKKKKVKFCPSLIK